MGIQIYIKDTDRYGVEELLNDLGFTKAGREIKAMQDRLDSTLSFLREVECDDPDCFNGLIAEGAGEDAEAYPCLFCKEKRELLGES